LRAVTLDAAWVLGDEARRGHLAPGTLADVTILSGDVTAAAPDEIRSMEVVATIVGGIPVHCADAATCGPLGRLPEGGAAAEKTSPWGKPGMVGASEREPTLRETGILVLCQRIRPEPLIR